MHYGELITGAFQIALRNRYLWFFGLFAGVSFNFQVQVPIDSGGDGGSGQQAPDAGSTTLEPGLILAIAILGLMFFLVLVALSVISHGALADSVAAIQRGETRGFRSAWKAGLGTFWRLLGLGEVVFAAVLALLLAVLLPIAGLVTGTFALTDGLALRVLAVIGAILLGITALVLVFVPCAVVAQHAVRELVVGGHRAIRSLRGGWRLLRRNFGHSLLLFLIQQGIVIGAAFALALALVVLSLPAILLVVLGSGAAQTVVTILTAVVVIPLALAVYGAIGAFGHTFWTLAYLQLAARPTD